MADGAQRAPRAGGLYRHLGHAMRILKTEPDYRKWGPLIERVPAGARAEVRGWLYVEAQKIRAFQVWRETHGVGG